MIWYEARRPPPTSSGGDDGSCVVGRPANADESSPMTSSVRILVKSEYIQIINKEYKSKQSFMKDKSTCFFSSLLFIAAHTTCSASSSSNDGTGRNLQGLRCCWLLNEGVCDVDFDGLIGLVSRYGFDLRLWESSVAQDRGSSSSPTLPSILQWILQTEQRSYFLPDIETRTFSNILRATNNNNLLLLAVKY